VLDETDSGLDSDAVRVVSEGLSRLSGPNMGVLIITHHERLLVFNKPQKTHVILAGRIVETGDAELARQLHSSGYGAVRERHPDVAALEKIALKKSAGKTAAEKTAGATSETELAAS
jgi:Fe-S cluster assembly ATP-binding protein